MPIVVMAGTVLVLIAALCSCLAFRRRTSGRAPQAEKFHWTAVVTGVMGAAFLLVWAFAL